MMCSKLNDYFWKFKEVRLKNAMQRFRHESVRDQMTREINVDMKNEKILLRRKAKKVRSAFFCEITNRKA